MDKDLEFHGTKKGGRRKTVSKRRAYESRDYQGYGKAVMDVVNIKKQKALRYLDKLIQKANDLDKRYPPFFFELKQLHRLVNDI